MVRLARELSRGVLDAAPTALLGVDLQGRVAAVNSRLATLFGYLGDELAGLPADVLLTSAATWVEVARAEQADAAAGGDMAGPRTVGDTGLHRDGHRFGVEVCFAAAPAGTDLLLVATIQPGADRDQPGPLLGPGPDQDGSTAHEVDAQRRLASIVQSSHDAIIGKTLDGVITSWNPGATRLYGYTEAEALGENIAMILPPDRQQEQHQTVARIARGERVEQYQTTRRRKDGQIIAVSVNMSPITDGAGRIVGDASVSRDIGERERTEAKYRALLDSAPDAIVAVGAAGRIVLVNTQAERLFGYRRHELLDQPIEVLVPEALRAGHPGYRRRYLDAPKTRPMGGGRTQLAARRRDGTEFPAEISLSAVSTFEGVLVSAAIRDVTERNEAQAERERLKAQAERERMERRLHQSQRLESLGQLAGGVAHDFNNLLAVILNYTSFIAEEIADAAAAEGGQRWEDARRDVEQVQRAAERATRLTHQLLAFGRREVVRPQVLDLNEVVSDVEQLLRRTIGEHVELATDLSTGLWPVKADPGQIEQVLVNLAVNARDAMPAGGTLTIDTENVDVSGEYTVPLAAPLSGPTPGRYVRMRVSDTGTGMPKDVAERAFEPFYTTKPKGKGTGLGLATVYGIISQAEGYAHIYSEPGLGTSVTALLPATDEAPASPEPPEEPARRRRGGETVLVVEDEDAMREVTRRILARNGYQVITAANGVEAYELARTRPEEIHLLLTDVVMPQMLGKEVAERIRQVRPAVQVLFMSGYARPVLASQGTLEAGVTLLEKPFSEPVLLDRVREVLDGATAPQPP